MSKTDYKTFTGLTFDDFRARAKDASLSANEKIGFPDSYREGFDAAILDNIIRLMPALEGQGRTVLDLGCGCSELATLIIKYAEKRNHTLLMADSEEMLEHLPKSKAVRKMPGSFPENRKIFEPYLGKTDAVIVYSVLQHVILTSSLYNFIDAALELLSPGGTLLLGDIPNISRRDRFFSTPAGAAFHRNFTGTDTEPEVELLSLKPGKIDDGIVFGIMQRYRGCGFETYLLPQPETLPMHNRREDLLIARW